MNLNHRSPDLIEEEIEDVKEIIKVNESLISDFPEDSILKSNLEYLKTKKTSLMDELKYSYKHYNIETIDFVIDKSNPPIIEALNLSYKLQDLFYPLAYASKNPVKRGTNIPTDIKNATTLGIRKATAGSLRISLKIDPLKSDPQKKFIPLMRTAINNFNTLISCGTDGELIKEQTERLGTQSIDRYMAFLETISKYETSVYLFDNDKSNEYKPHKLTKKFAEAVTEVIVKTNNPPDEKIVIEGELGVIDTFSQKFTIKDKERKKSIIEYGEHFTEQVKKRLEQYVKVEINIKKTYHEVQDKTDKKMELIRFIDST